MAGGVDRYLAKAPTLIVGAFCIVPNNDKLIE